MREILEVYIPTLDLHGTQLCLVTNQPQSRLGDQTVHEDKPELLENRNRCDQFAVPLCQAGIVMQVLGLLDRLDQVSNRNSWYVPSLQTNLRTSLMDEYCIMIYGKEFSNAF